MNKLPHIPPDIIDISIINTAVQRYFEDPDFKRTVDLFNERYLFWDELIYRVQDEEERVLTWAAMKLFRSQNIEVVQYPFLKMGYSTKSEIQKSLHLFDRYLSGIIQIQNRSLKLDKRYIVTSLIEESISSSILEGAVTTHRNAREMIEQKKKPKTHGEQMVLNNFKTMEMILKRQNDHLTPDLIFEIQQEVTKDTKDPEDVGHFRESNDIRVIDISTGITLYTPPDYHEIYRLINGLCDFANTDDDEKFVHPIVKGIIIHFLLGYIHPFCDGNGRTARSLFYWYTLSRGYWLMEYLSISRSILKSRSKYAKAYLYAEFDELDLTYFIRNQIECLNNEINELIKYIEDRQVHQKKARELIKTDKNITVRQAEILNELMDTPDHVFTIFQIAERFNVVYQTARTDLMHLVDLDYIVKEKRGKGLFFYYIGRNGDCR